jgi:hypothetical protein
LGTIIKRKLYKRGSSYETTVPMPLLFALDPNKKYNVLFKYDPSGKWFMEFEPIEEGKKAEGKEDKGRKGVRQNE